MDGSAVSALYQYKTARNNEPAKEQAQNEGVPASTEIKTNPQTQAANNRAEEARLVDNNIKTTLSTATLSAKNSEPATRTAEVRWSGEDDFHSPDWFAILGSFGYSQDESAYRRIIVYRDESSTAENPVFYIQARDEKGVKGYTIELNKIDPSNATRAEMCLLTKFMYEGAEATTRTTMGLAVDSNYLLLGGPEGYVFGSDVFLSSDTWLSERVDHRSIMGELAEKASSSPMEESRWYATQIKAMFAQIDSGDWSTLDDFRKQVSFVDEKEFLAMQARDDKKRWPIAFDVSKDVVIAEPGKISLEYSAVEGAKRDVADMLLEMLDKKKPHRPANA